jgi:spermidine/putrescine transport system substrate-binding protein
MDYYYRPEVAAQVAAYVNYVCPVEGAQEELEEDRSRAGREPVHLPVRGLHRNTTSKGFRALWTPRRTPTTAPSGQKVVGN